MLRVHDRPAEALGAGQLRRVALVVAVVAGAAEEKAGGQVHGLAGVGALGLDGPALLGRRPLGAHDAVVEADVAVDAVLARGVLDVGEDRRAVGDRLGLLPRAEAVAEREHVRV